MSRSEFVIATAAILFAAFMLGWFANWLVHRLTRVSPADIGELERMAQTVHQAETARDEAISYLEEREGQLGAEIQSLDAEYRAAMSALQDARAENGRLRDYVERMQAGG